jgi:hypothetical protein
MFNVYTTFATDVSAVEVGTLETTAVNVKLVDDEGATQPRIVSLFQDSAAPVSETFLYMYQDEKMELEYSTLVVGVTKQSTSNVLLNLHQPNTNEGNSFPLPNATWLLDNDSAEIVGTSVGQSSGSTYVLVTAASGNYCVYAATPHDLVLRTEACGTVPALSVSVYDAVFTSCGSEAPDLLCALVLSGDSNTKLLLTTYSFSGESNDRFATVLEMTSLALTELPTTTVGSQPSLAPSISSARIGQGETNVFIFSSSHNHILMTAVPPGDLFSSDKTKLQTSSWTAIGVGNHVDVSVGSSGVIMLVTDFGFCYNSHEHNTRSTEKVCSSLPKASKNVLDYTIGFEQDWAQLVTDASEATTASLNVTQLRDSYITPCHKRLLHGSFDQGSHPSVALSALPAPTTASAPATVPYFLEMHEALLPGDRRGDGGCGNPMHRGGLILDSFPIDEWMRNLEG